MEIRLLNKDCLKKEEFYKDFLEDKIVEKDEYFSGEVVYIKEEPSLPVYMGKASEEEKLGLFKQAFEVMANCYLDTDRDIHMNDKFLINVMDIIDDRGLAKVLKAKIKDRPDLGKDERYGRRVLFEFNKAYPVVMSPMLNKDELECVVV